MLSTNQQIVTLKHGMHSKFEDVIKQNAPYVMFYSLLVAKDINKYCLKDGLSIGYILIWKALAKKKVLLVIAKRHHILAY